MLGLTQPVATGKFVQPWVDFGRNTSQSGQAVGRTPLQDSVRFGLSRGERLLRKYGIDPTAVEVVSTGPKLDGNKKEVLIRLLEAHEHALKNQALGNFSGRYMGANILFNNGYWSLSSNIELNRNTVFCDERSAIVVGWNQALQKLSLKRLLSKSGREEAQKQLNVRMIATSTSQDDLSHPSPCSECQNWLAIQRYVLPDTQIVNLRKKPESGQMYLNVQTVRDLMPLNAGMTPSLAERPLAQLPVEISARAQVSLQRFELQSEALRSLVQAAKEAYTQNRTAEQSGKNSAAAVRLSTGQVTTGQRLDWTARWFTDGDLSAATKGLQDRGGRVQAVAYYGEDRLPGIVNLGVLAQATWGGTDTLITVVERDTIQIRTIQDYMTDIYVATPSRRSA